MRTKTDHKAGYSNTKLEMPTTLTIDRFSPAITDRVESIEDRPFFKTGQTVAAILE